tara:strand:+ start:4160 stop:4927 length:768 start_codon:yes stop_codon:yes gene_type:complete
MTYSETPSDLTPYSPALVEIQTEVREHFGWTESDDIESAQEMLRRVEESSVEVWARHNRAVSLSKIFRRIVIRESKVAILGAAVEPDEIISILGSPTLIVAADGASGVISEIPETLSEKAWSRVVCIVSDADGGEGTQQAVRRSIPIVLHAHGDNREDWANLLDLSESQTNPPELILTHQTQTDIHGMHNPGGFTDGDRAACFLTALGAKKENIKLLGTRSDVVGRWSGATHEPSKLQKLQWMEKILETQGLWSS